MPLLLLAACASAPAAKDVDSEGATSSTAQAETLKDLVLASAPAAVSTAPGRFEVFAQDPSNVLWTRTYEAGVFGPWSRLDADGTTTLVTTSKPAAVSRTPGTVDLFVRGGDRALWHRRLQSGRWGAWRSLGGVLVDAPTVASDAPGHLDVFAQGGDRALWRIRYRFEDVRPGVCRPALGCLGGADGWSQWESLGGEISLAPAAISMEPGRIDVVARGPARDLLHRFSTDGGATWSAFTSAGGDIASSPSIGAFTPQLRVYATAPGPSLWAQSYNGNFGWFGWKRVPLDGDPDMPSFQEPAVVTQPDGCDHLFGRASDGSLFHRGCGERNVVRIANSATGASDAYVLGNHATLALNDALLPSALGASSATFELADARWPRELFVLDTDARLPPPGAASWTGPSGHPVLPGAFGVPGFGPWVAGGRAVAFASIPGLDRAAPGWEADFGPFFTRRSVPWGPRAARLVDHGGCARKLVYTTSVYASDPEGRGTVSGLFSDIESGIYKGLEVAVSGIPGGQFAVRELKIEPAFLTPAGSTDASAVADGIAIAIKTDIWKHDPLTGLTGSLTWSAFVTYRVGVRDGMLDLTPMLPTNVWLSTNTTYDIVQVLGSVVNFFGGLSEGFATFFGASDPDFKVRLPPASGDLRTMLGTTFDAVLPQMVREQALGVVRARQPGGAPQAVGLCNAALSEAEGRDQCWGQRTTFLRDVVKQRLVARGVPTDAAGTRAAALAEAVPPETYDCVAPKDGGAGRCLWHPAVRRANVMPNRLELVWYDNVESADAEVVRIVAPAAAAAMCSDLSGDRVAVGPMRITKLDTTVRLR